MEDPTLFHSITCWFPFFHFILRLATFPVFIPIRGKFFRIQKFFGTFLLIFAFFFTILHFFFIHSLAEFRLELKAMIFIVSWSGYEILENK